MQVKFALRHSLTVLDFLNLFKYCGIFYLDLKLNMQLAKCFRIFELSILYQFADITLYLKLLDIFLIKYIKFSNFCDKFA